MQDGVVRGGQGPAAAHCWRRKSLVKTDKSIQFSHSFCIAGKTVWCAEGKGLPRRIADADTSSDRCVCVAPPATPSGVLQLYDGCRPEASKCVIADLM